MAIIHQYVRYKPVRNADTVAKMQELASDADKDGEHLLKRLEREAGAVAKTMQSIHGGDWRIRINHDTCFVVVSRKFP